MITGALAGREFPTGKDIGVGPLMLNCVIPEGGKGGEVSLDGTRRKSLHVERSRYFDDLFSFHAAILGSLAVIGRKVFQQFLEAGGVALGEVCKGLVAEKLGEHRIGLSRLEACLLLPDLAPELCQTKRLGFLTERRTYRCWRRWRRGR